MNTKTLTILAVVGGIAYMGYRTKQAAEQAAMVAAYSTPLPMPPPNSGPVVNGLSFYQLEGMSGFGSKLKKAVKKVAKVVTKVDPVAATVHQIKKTVDDPSRLKKLNPLNVVSKLPGANKLPLIKKIIPGGKKNTTPPEPGQEEVYQDVNGTVITKAQYDAIVQAMASGQPVSTAGGWALPQGYVSATKPEAPVQQSPPFWSGPAAQPEPHYAHTSAPTRPSYTPRPYEDLTVTNSYSDDYSDAPATSHTASSSGSPGLPSGLTTQVSTPAAQEAAPVAPGQPQPESSTGKLLVGTALAAGAAYLAFA